MKVTFDFLSIKSVLGDWPNSPVEGDPVDGLYQRIYQILGKSINGGPLQNGSDLLPLLRQAMQQYRCGMGCQSSLVTLTVPCLEGWPCAEDWQLFGFYCESSNTSRYTVTSMPWKPDWLPQSSQFDLLEDVYVGKECRPSISVPIDPCVKDATGFNSYSSAGQRESVRGAFFAPEGSTLVINLPTGSGKSLVGYLPSLLGGTQGNFTLFVVPTVSLAIEQAQKLRDLYRKIGFPYANTPLAWHGGVPEEDKALIKKNIKNGVQPILFTSPEAVCGALRWALYESAQRKFLKYFVVDEAHLVSQWGIEFRPDFQAMSGVWRGLLDATQNSLKTLLMTATLTDETLQTLEMLFSQKDKPFQVVSDVYLRPEPRYWHYKASNFQEKKQCVLESVRKGPRPLILYVTEPKDAEDWLKVLKQEGFSRVATFHGNTPNSRRLKVIDQWNANQLDIIVATSAFGVGMDKGDVRMILHAIVPENLDRFYQEVGRGGRDKRASLSLMIYTQRDMDKARGMSSPKVVTEELGSSRWQALVQEQIPLGGNLFQMDLATVPPYAIQQSDYNRAWNMRTLLLMVRAGAVQLVSPPPPNSADVDEIFTKEKLNKFFDLVNVRFLEGNHCNESFWGSTVASARAISLAASQNNYLLLKDVLENEREMGAALEELYSICRQGTYVSVARSCGGCSYCRSQGSIGIPFTSGPVTPIRKVKRISMDSWEDLFPMVPQHPVVVTYSRTEENSLQQKLPEVLGALAKRFGVREIVTPSSDTLQNSYISKIHQNVSDKFIVYKNLGEIIDCDYESPLRRITLLYPWDESPIPDQVLSCTNDFNLVIAPEDVQAGDHPHRLYTDTASNTIPLKQIILRLNK